MKTWRELIIDILTNNQDLDDTATVYLKEIDEYYGVEEIHITPEDDVLDKGHIVLVINA